MLGSNIEAVKRSCPVQSLKSCSRSIMWFIVTLCGADSWRSIVMRPRKIVSGGYRRRHGPAQKDAVQIAPLWPRDLRHTFGFQLAKFIGAVAYKLERRLGHRSQRSIQCSTNPPHAVAAGYAEGL
jgi:integrase